MLNFRMILLSFQKYYLKKWMHILSTNMSLECATL